MADLKWYEQRSFCWANDSVLEEPSQAVVDGLIGCLKADGWEQDPVNSNGTGWVHVRRLYRPRQTEGAGGRAEEPVDENSLGFGDLIAIEYPGATWKLTVKGGAW